MSVQPADVSSSPQTLKSLSATVMNLPVAFLAWNRALLLDYLDPFETKTTSNKDTKVRKRNWSLLFPAIIILCTFLLGTVYLEYEAKGKIDLHRLPSSPSIFTRQIFPPGLWAPTDMAAYIGGFGSFCMFVSLFKNPFRVQRYTIEVSKGQTVVRQGKSVFKGTLSLKIRQLRANLRSLSVNFQIALISICYLSFYASLLLNNSFRLTFPQVTVFFLLLPLMNIYVSWALMGMLAFVILSGAIVNLRQKSLFRRQTKVNTQIRQSKVHPVRVWQQYGRISAHLATLCLELDQISQFWSLPLSIIFLTHITLLDYMLYAFFFIENVAFFEKFILLYVIINLGFALFILINQCAKVVKHNRAIELANRRFVMLFQKMDGFSSLGLTNMLKAEARQLSHRLYPYAFRLFDGYRITSKTFYLVLVDTGLFFMLVFKHQ